MCLTLFVSCNRHLSKTESASIGLPVSPEHNEKNDFFANIFSNDTMPATPPLYGFGYDIFHNNILYIRQRSIPAVPGISGFKTIAEAAKTAALVLDKLKNNLLPPSISIKELDSLGISITEHR